MLDAKMIRDNIGLVQDNLTKRSYTAVDLAEIVDLEQQRKLAQTATQALQADRNNYSEQIAVLKRAGVDAASTSKINELTNKVKGISEELKIHSAKLEAVQTKLQNLLLLLPNLLADDVPYGASAADNVEQRRYGTPPRFAFTPRDHVALGEKLAGIDLASASKLSGARFVVLRGNIARLHRALAQFMLDLHVNQHGYEEISVPLLVHPAMLEGVGQLPKMQDDLFFTQHTHPLGLIPTAEVPLTNLVRDEILDVQQLPLRFVAHSTCFRKEAGSYGKDTRGMIRVHQFEKVELVQITRPDQSHAQLEAMVQHAEAVLQALELPYQVLSLCSGDIGFTAAKTYDLEVWLPSQNTYREISSCSNCTDFQARRMQARWRNPHTKKPELVHTLNGSGVAVGRALVAVLENYQQADGSILIPKILQPYMNGMEILHCSA